MKPISDTTMDLFEATACQGAERLQQFLKTESDWTPEAFGKAKLSATAISGYARLRASESNRMAVELALTRHGQK